MRRSHRWSAAFLFGAFVSFAGCAATSTDNDTVDESEVRQKSTRVLRCTATPDPELADLAKVEGTVLVYDLGATTKHPSLAALDQGLVRDGFAVRKYRLITKLSVNGGASRTIDRYFWGNLFTGDTEGFESGSVVSEDPEARELMVPRAGENRPYALRVSYTAGGYAQVALACTGKLPSEAEARGPDPNGLALAFDCSAEATRDAPKESFAFSAIRIDRAQSIGLVESNEDGWPVSVKEESELFVLNDNYTVDANATSIVLEGDGDGIVYGKLELDKPRAAGDEVRGRFKKTDSEENVLSDRAVTCKTRAL